MHSRSLLCANTAQVHALKTTHWVVFAPLRDAHGLSAQFSVFAKQTDAVGIKENFERATRA